MVSNDYPNIIQLAFLAFGHARLMQLAGCERGFPVQNQTLTLVEFVFTLSQKTQVMKIIINWEGYVNFDFSNALQIFKTITDRKILSK
jgi:hypothetical protein